MPYLVFSSRSRASLRIERAIWLCERDGATLGGLVVLIWKSDTELTFHDGCDDCGFVLGPKSRRKAPFASRSSTPSFSS